LTGLDTGTDVWLVLLAVAPDPDDPVFGRAADRWAELTPYAPRPTGPDMDLSWVQQAAGADPGVVAACGADVASCLTSTTAFATEADARAFVDLYADPVFGPYPWNTGSVD
jgi:hypothetical protein